MYDPFSEDPTKALYLAKTALATFLSRCALRLACRADSSNVFSAACEEFAVELTQLDRSIEWLYHDPMYQGFKHAIRYWQRRAVEARDSGDTLEFTPVHAEMFLRLARSIVEVGVRVANTPDGD